MKSQFVSLPPPRLIGLPYDASSSYLRGPAEAPPRIREAAADLSLSPTAAARAQIESGIAELLSSGARSLALGGDHSVTYPILRAVNRVYPKPSILQVDAHPDLYDQFEGDRFSHACPFARIMQEGLASRLIQVGIRTMNGQQHDQAVLASRVR